MIWEGSEALDDCGSDVDTVAPKTIAQKSKKPKVTVSTKMSSPVLPLVPPQSPSEESGAGSEDDYVAEEAESKATTSKGKVAPDSLLSVSDHILNELFAAPSTPAFILRLRVQSLIR